MKIGTKLTLIIFLFIIVPIIIVSVLGANNIRNRGQETLSQYRSEKVDTVKRELKDLVDIAYETLDRDFENLNDLDFLSRYYESKLHNIIGAGEAIIRRYQEDVGNGVMSLAEAKARALEGIKQLRFDGGTGYIWINDTGYPYPRMVMHPTIPALDGQILNDRRYNNAQGTRKNLFQAFVEVTENGQDGYVDYLWPKPTEQGLTEEVPKLSYVRRYEDWGWILGTGIYIDDAQAETENRIKENIRAMRYADGTGYFWINDSTTPFPKMIMHPTIPSLEGEVLDDPVYDNAQGVDKNLFVAFLEVTSDGDNEGYVDYLWPKPTKNGLTERREKISYVRLHEPSGWIVGSGAYLDSIEETIQQRETVIDEQIRELMLGVGVISAAFLVLAGMLSYFLASNIAKPVITLSKLSAEISRGKNLNSVVEGVDRKDEIGDLARSMDRLQSSVRILIERMRNAHK